MKPVTNHETIIGEEWARVETGEGWWACLGITHHWFCSPTGLERMKKGDGKPDTNLEGPWFSQGAGKLSIWEKVGHRTSWSSFGGAGWPARGGDQWEGSSLFCGPQLTGDSVQAFICFWWFWSSLLRGRAPLPPGAQASHCGGVSWCWARALGREGFTSCGLCGSRVLAQ